MIRILFLLVFAAVIGCEKEKDDPITEQFVGTYRVYDPDVVGEKLDSVRLVVEDNARYQFVNFAVRPGADVDICSSAGTVSGFGTNFAVFRPASFTSGNCDTVRIPRDTFVSDWRSHGDTVYMDRVGDSLTYELRLLMIRPMPD